MNLETQFKEEFTQNYSEQEFVDIQRLIKLGFETDSDKFDQTFTEWKLNLSIEKHHALQHTYYFNMYKETDKGYDEEISLAYYSGIENGTDLVDYSMDGSGTTPITKTVKVLKGVELILKDFKPNKDYTIGEIKTIPDKLMEIYNGRAYDNYVTGVTMFKENEYGEDYIKELRSEGLDWNLIYEYEEVDCNFI